MKESDIGQILVEYLRGEGWDCYPEVDLRVGRADIVAVRDKRFVWVIECKQGMSLALLDQAHRWVGYAHYISVALPRYKRMAESARIFMRDHGIGMLAVEEYHNRHGERPPVTEEIGARFYRDKWGHIGRYVLNSLHEDMKRFMPGGTAQSGYSTPWRRTMDAARLFIKNTPGCSVKELVTGINHHYQSTNAARNSLVHWLEQDSTVRVSRDGPIRFYPAGGGEGQEAQRLII